MVFVWAAAVTLALIIVTAVLCSYRRQVKEICRQLSFLHREETNMRLTSQSPWQDLNRLIDGMNRLLDDVAGRERENAANETVLKETIANLSHDIRTPLTLVTGYLDLMAQSESEEKRACYTGIIRRRLESLEAILEELFVYAKLQDVHYEIELAKVDFSKCAFDVTFSYYEEFERVGLTPEIDFGEERYMVAGNEEAIGRALQNIIKNALVHGVKGIRLKLAREGEDVVFSCANRVPEGMEIDPEQIFQRFYKMDKSRSQSSSGLGLSIVRGLAERMGGRAEARLVGEWFEIRMFLCAVG